MNDARQAAGRGGTGAWLTGEPEAPGLGDFVLRRELGTGGIGTVFLAEDRADGATVALKLIDPVASADDADVARFVRESDFLLSLDHPNLVKAFGVGALGEQYYLSMEYVPGETLLERIERDGRVEPGEALGIMRQIARALDYAAGIGLVHRDVKPENIFLMPNGTAKLADMGLAILASREDLRITGPGTVLGTPDYMSPEQAMAEHDVDVRADIYSLGCTFYHAICGRPPFPGDDNPIVALQRHLHETPTRPRDLVPILTRAAEAVLLKCIAKDPDRRYHNPNALVRALDTALVASGAIPVPQFAQPSTVRASEARQDFAFTDARPPAGAPHRVPPPNSPLVVPPLPVAPTTVPTEPTGTGREYDLLRGAQAARGGHATSIAGGGMDAWMLFLVPALVAAVGALVGVLWVFLRSS